MSITLLSGDCRDVLPTLAANSVHCVVTSPPYWNLRDYGTAQWDGGDAACSHAKDRTAGIASSTLDGGKATTNHQHEASYRDTCGKCGARRVDRQIGLEATPEAYLATMVAVFREVRRVLRPDGTLWLNIGDSYNANQGSGFNGNAGKGTASPRVYSGLAPKQLLMMPARLALALQADGWWVRSDIIWAKPNPMPESVTDRPTSAYEHVFLLTKSARYFYDADAVREESEPSSLARAGIMRKPSPKELTSIEVGNWSGAPGQSGKEYGIGRNCRNVWTLPTSPYSEAHFATFPPALAERCIRAGTSERGCCAACGAPWRREIDKAFIPQPDVSLARGIKGAIGQKPTYASTWDGVPRGSVETTTTGWAASCACAADVVPATVLDPFAGASTTLLVAQRLQRRAIGIELNPEYVTMGRQRIEDEAGLFADVQTLGGVPSDVAEPQPTPGFAQPDLFAEAAD